MKRRSLLCTHILSARTYRLCKTRSRIVLPLTATIRQQEKNRPMLPLGVPWKMTQRHFTTKVFARAEKWCAWMGRWHNIVFSFRYLFGLERRKLYNLIRTRLACQLVAKAKLTSSGMNTAGIISIARCQSGIIYYAILKPFRPRWSARSGLQQSRALPSAITFDSGIAQCAERLRTSCRLLNWEIVRTYSAVYSVHTM